MVNPLSAASTALKHYDHSSLVVWKPTALFEPYLVSSVIVFFSADYSSIGSR